METTKYPKRNKWTDYLGIPVKARYAVEHNIDGADVPVIREGEVIPHVDSWGSIFLDTEDGPIYPFDETFELLKPAQDVTLD